MMVDTADIPRCGAMLALDRNGWQRILVCQLHDGHRGEHFSDTPYLTANMVLAPGPSIKWKAEGKAYG